ncbi:MAG: hypothetical protein ACO1SV_01990 [Fimbriimonas sp.]
MPETIADLLAEYRGAVEAADPKAACGSLLLRLYANPHPRPWYLRAIIRSAQQVAQGRPPFVAADVAASEALFTAKFESFFKNDVAYVSPFGDGSARTAEYQAALSRSYRATMELLAFGTVAESMVYSSPGLELMSSIATAVTYGQPDLVLEHPEGFHEGDLVDLILRKSLPLQGSARLRLHLMLYDLLDYRLRVAPETTLTDRVQEFLARRGRP